MRRTNMLDLGGLIDPLLQYNFDMFIANIPGVSNFDARGFRTKILTSSIPGRTIEPVLVDLHGSTKEFAGRTQYSRTLTFDMIELRDLRSRDALNQWSKFTRNDSSMGAYSTEYCTTVDLQLYDEKDVIIRTIRLHDAWLESFDDAAVDGSGSAAVTVSGTLKYFYHSDI